MDPSTKEHKSKPKKHHYMLSLSKFSLLIEDGHFKYFRCTVILVTAFMIAYIIAATVVFWRIQSSSSLLTTAGVIGIIPVAVLSLLAILIGWDYCRNLIAAGLIDIVLVVTFIIVILIGCVFCRNIGGANPCVAISSGCLTLIGVLFLLIAAIIGINQEQRDTYNLFLSISIGVLFLLTGIIHYFGCG